MDKPDCVLNNGDSGPSLGTPMYYAVFVPPQSSDNSQLDDGGGVYEHRDMALSAVRKGKSKDARYKQFQRQESAEKFAKFGLSASPESKRRKITTRSMSCSTADEGGTADLAAPTKPELSELKRKIEQGLLNEVEAMLRENPRFLINISSDSPTVIHTGCHYNAIHIAARSGHAPLVKLILQLINDPKYLSTLYIKESDALSKAEQVHLEEERREKLMDLYLNTPDKGMCETALHMAAKAGFLDVVQQLTMYSQCNKDPTNKRGKTPAEIACTRMEEEENLKLKVEVLQHLNPVYVALYRSECSTKLLPPFRGYPQTRLEQMSPISIRSPAMASDLVLCAMAGPTNFELAEKLYVQWNSGRSCTQIDRSVKRSDPHKGMERIGRRLASSLNIQWTEYWPFLEKFADLREESGWELLEKYLERKMCQKNDKCLDDVHCRLTFDDDNEVKLDTATPMAMTSEHTSPMAITSEHNSPMSMTSQHTPHMAISSEHTTPTNPVSPVTQLCNKLMDLRLHSPPQLPLAVEIEKNKAIAAGGEDEFEDFEDALETDISLDDSQVQQQFYTPPSTPPGAYLGAAGPSKVDLDVLNAIQDGVLPEDGPGAIGYPLLGGWVQRMNFFSEKDRKEWPALDSPRAKTFTRVRRRLLD